MPYSIKTTVTFSDQDIDDMIDTADIEYWISHYETHADNSFTLTVEGDIDNDELYGKTYTITRERIEAGLQTMAEKAPAHFADLVSENYDSETCDVLIQFCCFGEIIFG